MVKVELIKKKTEKIPFYKLENGAVYLEPAFQNVPIMKIEIGTSYYCVQLLTGKTHKCNNTGCKVTPIDVKITAYIED